MTEADRTLAALAAALAPASAAALLARLASPDAAETAARAQHLAGLGRRERLLALASAMPSPAPASPPVAAVALERPRVAALLGALRKEGAPRGASLVLVRLCRERW